MVILLVILTITIAVIIDILFLKGSSKVPEDESVRLSSPPVFSRKDNLFPAGYYYSQGHTWIKQIDENDVKIGIDDFVLKALGRIKLSNIAKPGTKITKGDVIFEAKYNNNSISFRSPVDGIVKFSNNSLIGKYIKDPYEKDWGISVKATNFQDNITSLIRGKLVIHWMKSEFTRLKNFLIDNSSSPELVGVTMYDGGNIVEGAVSLINEDGLKEFEEQFLKM